jgi:hypothetical protein
MQRVLGVRRCAPLVGEEAREALGLVQKVNALHASQQGQETGVQADAGSELSLGIPPQLLGAAVRVQDGLGATSGAPPLGCLRRGP